MTPTDSHYRRALPVPLIPFSSDEGRALFSQALEAGTLESFFPLVEQFHTQTDPAFCGLGSLVMALNALGIDPQRVWRGPWRWFSEELLDCCTSLDQVRQRGLSLDEVACLARCNGADVSLARAEAADASMFRTAVQRAVRSRDSVLIVSYARALLEQTGGGHFSPVGGYHEQRDLVLVLDVARFKYPPHWVPLEALYRATCESDPATGRSRGWLLATKRGAPSAIAHFLNCREGMKVKETVERLLTAHASLLAQDPPATLDALLHASARALEQSGLLQSLEFRPPHTAAHSVLLGELRERLGELELTRTATHSLGPERAPPVVLWLLAAPDASWRSLPEALRAELLVLLDASALPELLAREVLLLRSQVEFLLDHARSAAA